MIKNPFSFEKKPDKTQNRTVIGLPFHPLALQDVLVIVRKNDGSIDVAGPIHERERCLALMREGMARVINYSERANPSLIQPAQCIPPGPTDVDRMKEGG
jgi:hypothetical protein